MLFLNKYDLFKKKYYHARVPLEKPFADCPPPPTVDDEVDEKSEKAVRWFLNIFLMQIRGRRNVSEVYSHVTTALDENNIARVLDNCCSYVLRNNFMYVIH